MVQCAVFGCNNNNNKKLKKIVNNGENNHFYRFPKNENMCKIWVVKCNRTDKFKVENARICQKHFQKNDFMRNLKHELLNYNPITARKLKEEAIPNKNLPIKNAENEKSKKRESKIAERNKKIIIVNDLKEETKLTEIQNIDPNNRVSETSFQDFEFCDAKVDLKTPNDRKCNESKVIKMKMKFMKLKSDNNILKLSIKNLKILHKNLKRQIKKMNMENNNLKKENFHYLTERRELKKIFTPGQIRKLQNPSKNISRWSGNDIAKAISLHAAGAKAYRFLLKTNYPLPGESTLRRWAQRKLNKTIT